MSLATHPADNTVRAFWHGDPLTGYQAMCLRSFVDHGCAVEVFSYDKHLSMPAGVRRREAAEVWPTDEVMLYQSGFGTGSPSLHSNLFRYAMLHQLGGWWIDLDVVSLGAKLPLDAMYFARERADLIAVGTLRFPAGHVLLQRPSTHASATARQLYGARPVRNCLPPWSRSMGWSRWPKVLTPTYPVPWREIAMLLDPSRFEEAEAACRQAHFLHLYDAIWRHSRIPVDLRPPEGSFLDMLVERHSKSISEPIAAWNARRLLEVSSGPRLYDRGERRVGARSDPAQRASADDSARGTSAGDGTGEPFRNRRSTPGRRAHANHRGRLSCDPRPAACSAI